MKYMDRRRDTVLHTCGMAELSLNLRVLSTVTELSLLPAGSLREAYAEVHKRRHLTTAYPTL
jgi:hypothetical protein